MLDESLSIWIVLRTPQQPEAELKAYLVRLAINLQASAYGFLPGPSSGQDVSRESSPARNEDTLWSGSIDTSSIPVIIACQETDENSSRQMLAIWKMTIPLSGSLTCLPCADLAYSLTT